MSAAPQFGTMTFMGVASKRIYNVDCYFSDVADGLVNFDGGAGASATSPESFTAPEPLLLQDMAIVTGMTDTTKVQILRNNQPTGDFLRYTMHLTTAAFRSRVQLGFNQGVEVRAIQKA
jgi:predicted secreted protein